MKNLVIAVLVVLVIAVGAVFLVLGNINSVMKQGIETAGPKILNAPVEVSNIDVSFLSGSGVISGLKVGNPEGYKQDYAMAIDKVLIELDPMSITSDKIIIKKIVIDGPSIFYEGSLNDSNIQQLQRNALVNAGQNSDSADEASSPEQESAQTIQIDHFELNNANIKVALSFLEDEPLSLTLPALTIEDIGKDEDVTSAEAMQKILRTLNQSLLPLIQENAGDLGNQFKAQGEKLKDSVNEGVKKLKSLFKR